MSYGFDGCVFRSTHKCQLKNTLSCGSESTPNALFGIWRVFNPAECLHAHSALIWQHAIRACCVDLDECL
ncbi:hypothetical protein J4G08_04690, partial [Candidatus Poribacteria bacterium]|nr:hypothetical protein [Candidatus Poribacteria bacterium]